MSTTLKTDPAERRRRTLLSATAVLFLISGGVLMALADRSGPWRPVDIVQVSALMVLAVIVALRSTTSVRLTPRNPVLDDETTRANRASAALTGFWCLMAGVLLAIVGGVTGTVTLAQAAPMLIVIGAIGAGIRFAVLESRGGADE